MDYQSYSFKFFFRLDSAPLAPNSIQPVEKTTSICRMGAGREFQKEYDCVGCGVGGMPD
jgi:hypothetical protein